MPSFTVQPLFTGMTHLDIYVSTNGSKIDIDKVSLLYGNRKTVVHAFLTDKLKNHETIEGMDISIFELIELQLGYPIPIKIRKILADSKNS